MNPQNPEIDPSPTPDQSPQPFTPNPSLTPDPAESPKPGKRKGLIIGGSFLLLLILGGIAFAVTNSLNKPASSSSSSGTNAEKEAALQELLAEDQSADEEKAIVVEKTDKTSDALITDSDTGVTIRADKVAIKPFAVNSTSTILKDKIVVLVNITVTNNGQYTGAPSAASLDLIASDGTKVVSTTSSDNDMKAAGYTISPVSGPSSGKSTIGYVAYWVDAKYINTGFTLRYDRSAMKVLNGGQTIPAKTFDTILY